MVSRCPEPLCGSASNLSSAPLDYLFLFLSLSLRALSGFLRASYPASSSCFLEVFSALILRVSSSRAFFLSRPLLAKPNLEVFSNLTFRFLVKFKRQDQAGLHKQIRMLDEGPSKSDIEPIVLDDQKVERPRFGRVRLPKVKLHLNLAEDIHVRPVCVSDASSSIFANMEAAFLCFGTTHQVPVAACIEHGSGKELRIIVEDVDVFLEVIAIDTDGIVLRSEGIVDSIRDWMGLIRRKRCFLQLLSLEDITLHGKICTHSDSACPPEAADQVQIGWRPFQALA